MHAKDNIRSSWQPVWSLMLFSLLLLGFMIWNVGAVQNKIVHGAEKFYLQEQTAKMSASIEQVNQEAEKLSLNIASDEKLRETFQEADTSLMNQMLPPVYKQWKERYGVAELSLIYADGKAAWSSNPDIAYGDDMSYQRIVGQSLWQKETVSALESSGGNNLFVTTVPLFDGDEYLGSCKIGISIPYLGSKLQKSGTGKYALFHLNGIESSLLWENKKAQASLNTADVKKLHDGEVISRSLDRSTTMLVIPLQDIDGITVAYLQNQVSLRQFAQAELLNYFMLLLAFLFIIWANYVCGRGRSGYDHDYGDHLPNMSKINKVAFHIQGDQTQKRSNQDG